VSDINASRTVRRSMCGGARYYELALLWRLRSREIAAWPGASDHNTANWLSLNSDGRSGSSPEQDPAKVVLGGAMIRRVEPGAALMADDLELRTEDRQPNDGAEGQIG
jgi:hypothetical protein